MRSSKNKRVIEELHHFTCYKCKKWWSVSEAPENKEKWWCPWCGEENRYKKVSK